MVGERKFSGMPHIGPTGRLSRRALLRRAAGLGLSTPALAALLAACGGSASTAESADGAGTSDETPSGVGSSTNSPESSPTSGLGQRGGTLTAAYFDEPATLDIHLVTSRETGLVGWNIYEPLFAWSTTYEAIPMLAEAHEVSDDGLTHTLTIRQGVPFHTGQLLTAADVVASIQRWATKNSIGKEMLALVEQIEEVDEHTIEFHFTQPYSIFASALGLVYQGCAIYPKSVVEAAGDGEITEYVGTGPYRFVSWDRGRSIRLERFEEYAALPGEPNGYGGHKYAYLDAMEFVPVGDEAARVAGLRAGDYTYAERISGDQVPTLEGDPEVAVVVVSASGWDMLNLNWRSPITGDAKIREAIQVALSCEPILEAGRGAGFYELYPSLMPKGTIWYTEAGGERYNQGDIAKAQQLLQEAGYDGAPLRLMTTQQDVTKYQASVVIQQQLEQAGFTVDLQIYDWATVNERRNDPDLWEGYVTNTSFRPEPTMMNPMKLCNYAGWWCSADSEAVLNQLLTESDFETRYQAWEQLQTLAFEEVPNIYLGHTNDVFAHSKRLLGLTSQAQLGAILWNCWLEN